MVEYDLQFLIILIDCYILIVRTLSLLATLITYYYSLLELHIMVLLALGPQKKIDMMLILLFFNA